MTGMLLSSGIPRWLIVRVSWISPPSTSVWLFRSTTDVSASRLRNDGEFVGATAGPTELTSCLTSSATVPRSPMRGVTVRMTPASRYSTVWLTPPVVMLVLVVPPVVPGVLTVLVCWPVMIGTDCETLMMAFLFSDVIMCGLLMTLTRLSEAKALRIAKNLSVAKVNPVSPPAGRPAMVVRAPIVSKPVGVVIVGLVFVDVVMDCCATLNLPARSAQSMPSCMSLFSVISATRTSISTWRGILSSERTVGSMSAHWRGVVVTITEFVVSSAMKRNWPSASPTSVTPRVAPGAAVGAGGGGGSGCPAARPVRGGVGCAVGTVSLAP